MEEIREETVPETTEKVEDAAITAAYEAGRAAAALESQAGKKVGIIGLDTSHSPAFTKIMNVDKDPAVAGFRVVAA